MRSKLLPSDISYSLMKQRGNESLPVLDIATKRTRTIGAVESLKTTLTARFLAITFDLSPFAFIATMAINCCTRKGYVRPLTKPPEHNATD
jgi:hypothetical protein